ncbi:hypothetical protein BHF71_10685 [Vulcanibacillus modesticaldus]|uniref:HTH cro/C1-type domain-containing protein n=1 Tax=Vulcanibacillus modesticaldus TaxID=337097 RepID=A0A1D2YT19_9BACI|nr:helix-turn-helix domain-containing protein [Vulcanibacillus modesticaldus]OEF98854.1 hypothetical protein BHF71_10685 [Vulcanibacillus modesticaldus]
MTLGERIKSLRKANKMTQLDLAKYLGKDNTTISKWESDIYQPDADELKRLAEILSTTTDYLLGRSDSPVEFTEEDFEFVRDLELTDEEIMEKYNFNVDGVKLTEEEIKGILAFVRANRHLVEMEKKEEK